MRYGYACQTIAKAKPIFIYHTCYGISNVLIRYLFGDNYFAAKRSTLSYYRSRAIIEGIPYSVIGDIVDISVAIRFIVVAIPYHRAITIPTIAPTNGLIYHFAIYC